MDGKSGARTHESPRVITVLVASPEELRPERELVEKIIRDLNHVWIETLDVYLDLVKWESAPFGPGIHIDSYVNKAELRADDYDTFIGLLWGHFHTPPPSWVGAGTVKEFERAYESFYYKQTCEALFFFKEAADQPLQISDAQAKVREFRAHIGKPGIWRRLVGWARREKRRAAGTFYRDYAYAEQLAALFRDDLTRAVEVMVTGKSQSRVEAPEAVHKPEPARWRRTARLLLDRLLNSTRLLIAIAIAITLTGISALVLEDALPAPTYADEIAQIVGYIVVVSLVGRLIWKLAARGGSSKFSGDGDGAGGDGGGSVSSG